MPISSLSAHLTMADTIPGNQSNTDSLVRDHFHRPNERPRLDLAWLVWLAWPRACLVHPGSASHLHASITNANDPKNEARHSSWPRWGCSWRCAAADGLWLLPASALALHAPPLHHIMYSVLRTKDGVVSMSFSSSNGLVTHPSADRPAYTTTFASVYICPPCINIPLE